MDTLSLQKIIHSSLCSGSSLPDNYPAYLEGAQGSFSSFYAKVFSDETRNIINRSVRYETKLHSKSELDCVFVVPSEKEAAELEVNLTTIFSSADGVLNDEIYNFSWWGTVPYRASAKGSSVFGQRAFFLSMLADKSRSIETCSRENEKRRFFIINQRSLLNPVPPKEYIQNLSFKLHCGESFDPQSIAQKLVALGYIRVPRVYGCGEFALRGEVLDIMSGEGVAYRVVFDFDKIEKIRSYSSRD